MEEELEKEEEEGARARGSNRVYCLIIAKCLEATLPPKWAM